MTASYDPREHQADCDHCPLKGAPVVPPNVNVNARAIIVGEAPGKEEVEQGRPFVGASGLELNRALKMCGVDRRTLHITNTLLCQPPENNYAKLEKQVGKRIKKGEANLRLASQCCLPRLLNEIAAHPCANLITLGSTAFKAVSHSDSSVMSVRGGPREVVITTSDDVGITKRLLPTVHPAFVLRARRWTRAFTSDMSRAFRWFSTGLGWQDPRMGIAPRPDQLQGWINRHRRDRFIVCDVETLPGFPDVGHFDPLFDKLTVIGLGSEDGREAIVIPIRTKDGVPRYENQAFAAIREILIDFFRDPTIVKSGWNFGYYDRMVIAARLGVEPLPIVDGIGLHKMVEPELPHRLGYVGSICTDAPSWKEDHTATTYETDEQLWLYNARDNAITAMSVTQCIRGVKERDQVRAAQFWPKVQETCVGLHRNGMRVDQAKRREYDHDLLVEAIRLRKELRERTGLPKFNPNSNPQLQDLLFESWGLLPTFYTDAGDPSTNDDSLRSFLMQPTLDPNRKAVIKALRAYRAAVKLRGTYVTKLSPITEPIKVPELAWDEDESAEEREDRIKKDGKKYGICLPDGRVHGDYSAHGTVGWRLSSSRPNCQNFPSDLRDMIIPAEGNILVGCDEAQLELRMVAGLSGAAMYCAAFSAGEDPHLDLCRAFFGDVFERASKDGKKKLRVLIKQFTYACAAEGTLVATLDEAGEKPIEKLVPGVDFVWCWDGEKYVAVQVKTKTNNGTRQCYRVTYEWIVPGEPTPRRDSVEFTGDHLFIMRDGSDKRVDALRPGDALMPFGRWKVGRYRVLDRFNDRGRVAEHRAVMDYDGEGHVHHRDGNGCNNLPANLEVCSVHDHLSGHWTEERRKEHRAVNRALWADGQTMNSKLTAGRTSSEKWREAVRRNIEKARAVREQTGASNKGQTWSKLDAFRDQIGVLLDRDVAKLAGVTQAAISYYRRTRKIPPPPGQRVNHRVVSVEFVGNRQVWDIEVDHPAHNFALAAGIFVHNSAYRAEPGTIWEILTSGEEWCCPSCATPLKRKSDRCETHPKAHPEKRLVFPELTIRETTALHQTWLGRNPEIEKWWERDLTEFKRQGFLAEPIFGLKRDFLDGEEINEIANYKAQCVPGFTRVLTDRGYVPIEEIVGQRFMAWTGKKWAPAIAIRKGEAPIWAVRTDRGITFHADASHELLVPQKTEYGWRRVDELRATDSSRVALDLARPLEFGVQEDAEEGWVAGFWIAEGSASRESERDVALKFSQNDEARLRRVERWATSHGMRVTWDRSLPCLGLTVYVGGELWLRSWGIDPAWRSSTKRVPERIWRSDLATRRAFLIGMLDGDGYLDDRNGTVRIHLCQRRLLEDLWLLARTVGVDGLRIHGPNVTDKAGHVAYTLVLSLALCFEHLGWGRPARQKSTRVGLSPWWESKRVHSRLRPTCESDSVLRARISKAKGTINPYVLRRMGVDDLYDHARVTGHMSRDVILPVFTLCVDDPEHRYVAEGFISKNSGGSALVHLATERVKDAIPFEKWGPGTGIIQQGHDALVVECPRDHGEWVKNILEEAMKEDGTPYGMPLPFIGEGKIGPTWRDV